MIDDIAVNFANVQLVELVGKRLGNRGKPWSNFYHNIIGLRANSVHNIGDDAGVLQEILPKAFAGLMLSHDVGLCGKKERIVLNFFSGCLKRLQPALLRKR